MYTISVRSHINASPVKLMRIWRNPRILLKHATSIKKLEVLKRDKNRVLTAWEVEIDKILLKWSQWDMLDRNKGIISFKLHEGDFHSFDGQWIIASDRDNRSTVSVEAGIDWGIPMFESAAKSKLKIITTNVFKDFIISIKTTCLA